VGKKYSVLRAIEARVFLIRKIANKSDRAVCETTTNPVNSTLFPSTL
jgi:hypothetical protein